ncbi:MAG: DUF362 domain-containing protein [Candidatus Eisenbacteria sp.]|nr:DUF362 domain-containing protein [Candidatus Eisenbacteria bacterium]
MADVVLFRSPDSRDFDAALKESFSKAFPPGGRVAVKLHMGEGSHHFDEVLAARCVFLLKELGMEPFLFDSPVMYSGNRDTATGYLKRAAENGFSEKTMGCPVLVSNKSEKVEGNHFPIGVCRDLVEADGILVLSHFKGHPCCGAAGALKNLGMGGVDRDSKAAMHAGAKPVLTGECDACGLCAEGCPGSSITISETAVIHQNSCWGCDRCVDVCPNNALEPNLADFNRLLIDGAAAVLSKAPHTFYVNDVRKITRLCDCCSDPGNRIAPDVGVLLGTNPVAIDQASTDLAIQAAGKDVFFEEHARNPYAHVREAAERGLGSLTYLLESG